jgi:malate synthase
VVPASGETGLQRPAQFAGYTRRCPAALGDSAEKPQPAHRSRHRPRPPIGGRSAGIADIVLESAISTIMDCEDSVAAVDAEDKVEVYRNWLGLMRGTLSASFEKAGATMVRKLNPDHIYNAPDGGTLTCPAAA